MRQICHIFLNFHFVIFNSCREITINWLHTEQPNNSVEFRRLECCGSSNVFVWFVGPVHIQRWCPLKRQTVFKFVKSFKIDYINVLWHDRQHWLAVVCKTKTSKQQQCSSECALVRDKNDVKATKSCASYMDSNNIKVTANAFRPFHLRWYVDTVAHISDQTMDHHITSSTTAFHAKSFQMKMKTETKHRRKRTAAKSNKSKKTAYAPQSSAKQDEINNQKTWRQNKSDGTIYVLQ